MARCPWSLAALLVPLTAFLVAVPVAGEEPAAPTAGVAETEAAEEGLIQLNFPENVEIKALIDYVAMRLGMNILYDEGLVRKRVTILSPTKVPADSLLGLLESILKASGLALRDADQPGWKEVVSTQALIKVARDIQRDPADLDGEKPTAVVMQVFRLDHADPQTVEGTLKPFLSTPGGNSFRVAGQRTLFVTDYVTNLRRVAEMIALLDRPGPKATVRFVAARHWEAGELAQKVTSLLAEKDRVAGLDGKAPERRVSLAHEPRTNQVVLIAAEGEGAEALALLDALDVPLDVETRTHRFEHVSPQRIDKLAREFAGPEGRKAHYKSVIDTESNSLIVTASAATHEWIASTAADLEEAAAIEWRTYRLANVSPSRLDRLAREYAAGETYKSTADEESGLLIVTAAADVHAYLEQLRAELDVAVDERQQPVRFYKLLNTTVSEVMATIRSLEGGEGGLAGIALEGPAGTKNPRPDALGTGPNLPPAGVGQALPEPPSYHDEESGEEAAPEGEPEEAERTAESAGNAGEAPARDTFRTSDAIVTADVNTNTLIVVAPPSVQRTYERLVRMLDKRRPQVMIEVTLVTLDTSGDFSLGIELSGGRPEGDPRWLLFSSFGLSEVDPTTAALSLVPGVGFNGVVLDPETVNVVIRALASNGRSQVVSAPKILVNDHGSGTLQSVAEAPFTSVNASQTVATTSFAGYASAGTTISVTPHIAEGDHLRLDYSVALNSFTGAGAEGVPPPRQTDTVSSNVTVPDGYAVVVGGLTRSDQAETVSKVPLLGDVPGLKYLFSTRSRTESRTTLFVFLRPVVLRDDRFEDLKYLSASDLETAGRPPNVPASSPMLME